MGIPFEDLETLIRLWIVKKEQALDERLVFLLAIV